MIDRQYLDDDNFVKWDFFEVHVDVRAPFAVWFREHCDVVIRYFPYRVRVDYEFMLDLKDGHPSRRLLGSLVNGWVTYFDGSNEAFIACETEDDAVLARLLLGPEALG